MARIPTLILHLLTLCLLASPTAAQPQHSPIAADRQLLLARWNAFCDSLKTTGQRIIELDRDQSINTAEGFSYLAMLTGMAIERIQGYETPAHPQVSRALDTYKKMGLDSSDNTYRVVRFEPGGEYRIRGWRGNSTYLGFQLNRGISAVGNLHQGQMQFNTDGSFELYIGGAEREGNWMALPEGADNMYVREIFIDWTNEQGSRLWLDRLDLPGPPAPLTAEQIADRLDDMAEFVSSRVEFWNGYVERGRQRTNDLPAPRGTTAEGGSADNLYSGAAFEVAPDEALVIETEAVPALFWNVQLGNNWFQSMDYQYRQTSLNSAQAVVDSDGRIRVVVSHVDPGVANWLDTAGHSDGVIYYRWNMAERVPGVPLIQRVKLADLDALLPADTARVSPAQRAQALQQRAQDVARRFAL